MKPVGNIWLHRRYTKEELKQIEDGVFIFPQKPDIKENFTIFGFKINV